MHCIICCLHALFTPNPRDYGYSKPVPEWASQWQARNPPVGISQVRLTPRVPGIGHCSSLTLTAVGVTWGTRGSSFRICSKCDKLHYKTHLTWPVNEGWRKTNHLGRLKRTTAGDQSNRFPHHSTSHAILNLHVSLQHPTVATLKFSCLPARPKGAPTTDPSTTPINSMETGHGPNMNLLAKVPCQVLGTTTAVLWSSTPRIHVCTLHAPGQSQHTPPQDVQCRALSFTSSLVQLLWARCTYGYHDEGFLQPLDFLNCV